MKRQSMMRYFIVALLTVVCAVFCLAACKGGTEFNVTWNIDQHAEVKVEGYDTLPAKVKDGDTLTFTVTGKDGYTVDEVLRNGKVNINETDGKYSVKISADTTIDVTTKKEVDKVEVTTKPTKLTYFAGESLDKTGMEVSVSYKTGDSEKLADNQYRVVYASATSASTFAVGEDSFKVSYDGIESAPVALDSKVKGLVTIDLHGATLAQAYIDGLNANTELADVKVEDGKLTFTFAEPLNKAVTLPAANQLTVEGGEVGDYIFLGWTIDGTVAIEIAAGTKTSVTVTSQWDSQLVEFKHLSLEMKGSTPMLVIEGTFHAAQEVYLWLYEGNKFIDLTGPSVKGNRGEAFKLEYDLQELSADEHEGKYKGAWMDIKVRAARGEVIDEQQINLENFPDDFVDTTQKIHDDRYQYSFKVHTPDNTTQLNLKVVYEDYEPDVFEYAIKAGNDADGNATFIIEGKILDSQYFGKAAAIDWWIDAAVSAVYAPIGSDGAFTFTLVLTPENGYKLNAKGYAHFWLVESESDPTAIYGSNSSNLPLNITNMSELTNHGTIGGFINGKSLRCVSADGAYVYYVGAGDSGNLCIYGRTGDQEAGRTITYDSANYIPALKVDDMTNPTKVYFVIYATVEGYTEEELLNNIHLGDIPKSGEPTLLPCEKAEKISGNLWRLWFNITSYEGNELYPNVYSGNDASATKFFEVKDGTAEKESEGLYAIANGYKYTIKLSEWNNCCFGRTAAETSEQNPETADPAKWPEVVPEPGPGTQAVYEVTDVQLKDEDGKIYLVLSGTYSGCTKEEAETYAKAVYFDLQHNDEIDKKGWGRTSSFPRTVTVTETTWEIKLDITKAEAGSLTCHFGAKDPSKPADKDHEDNIADLDVNVPEINGRKVTVGKLTCTLYNKPGSSAGTDFWGHVGVIFEDAETRTLTFTSAKLEVSSDNTKAYLVLTATMAETDTFTEEELKTIVYYDGDKTIKVESVSIEGTTVTLRFNFTDAKASDTGEWYWGHWEFNGRPRGDIKCAVTASGPITVGDKTFELKTEWEMPIMIVRNVATA